ncbi:Alpha-protein kinase 1 [Nibea albiflora]|uniref:Alpha-protein kinase 1 n=1 Tax=Nibea albiflora TaxID=240163 RepID=A0ACB7EVM9_NIBAL|nr:Alpha-protein kinase 1 [Nibea albiflora]
MDSQEVGKLLEECLSAAREATPPTEAERLNYCSSRDSLCAELASLLQEAMEMKWPFVPEKWQYKQSVSANDKTNLSDLISKHLSQLLAFLKASIVAQEARSALAVVFLVDRFLYWTDESSRLLKITKLLHRRHHDTPVAPQLIIRQARVYLNSGKLQKAEYILSSLINNSGSTGCWMYHSGSDRALVQAVSVQVRGIILQKLGLWLEAAELIWASLVGYYALPQPDKKGISTSLGILANILVSMNDEDFHVFTANPNIDLSLLGDGSHRLLSAAQAAKMAVVYSQYTSLYVLTNVATQGTCLLSYSFSVECPASQRQSFLLQASEAFSIGLLTKAEGELVTSKQELHTFIKAAYSLTVTHKWLGAPQEVVAQATQACQKALARFYDYDADTQDKDSLCAEIMHLVNQVKLLLHVEPLLNSDKGSFIPDSYRNIKDTLVNFTLEGFAKVMQRFQKYHASLCEVTNTNCKRTKDEIDGSRLCITALGTTIGTLNTECSTASCKVSKDAPKGEESQQRGSHSSAACPPQSFDQCNTLGSTDNLGSSWQNFSLSSSGSPRPSNSGYTRSIAIERDANASNQSCVSTEADDDISQSMLQSNENKKQDLHGCTSGISSLTVLRSPTPPTSSSNVCSDSEKFEVIQADIETQGSDGEWVTDVGEPQKQSVAEGASQSLSQLTLRTSSSSLSDSFSSHSSWEKISADLNSPMNKKPQPNILSKAGTIQSSKSTESDGSFSLLETQTSDSGHDPMHKNHITGWEFSASSMPRPLESFHIDPNMGREADSVSVKPPFKSSIATPHSNISHFVPEQCAPTETSSESSFEMLEEKSSWMLEESQGAVQCHKKVNVPHRKNPLCYSCPRTVAGVDPERQYFLSKQDYQGLLAGVCHECLLKRLHSDKTRFKLKQLQNCLQYVGKDYLKPMEIQFHLKDVERQMTAQYYVTEFNKSLYDKEVMAQIFFIPSEALLLLNGNEIVGCVTVEPYMLGDFVKLTNNTVKTDMRFQATKYGLAFGHFTYLFSDYQEVVVYLQGASVPLITYSFLLSCELINIPPFFFTGWVTANGKGLTYLTDPQIHSTKTSKGRGNFADAGFRYFLKEQHGPECNDICHLLKLPPVVMSTYVLPQKPCGDVDVECLHSN